ncbi:MAG: AAA family ATPase [Alphaproteobacteria bacterium]|nr:AAA family ATPase [Alphaproteobacteria bacterium]
MLIDDQSAVIAALSEQDAYGFKPLHKIIVKETNISDVFLTGEKAYKLKRGVKYPYVDYSTPEKRLAACRRELEICERFAPGLCFGVEEVVSDKKGRIFLRSACSDEKAEVVDYVLVMQEFEENMLFENMVDRGDLDRFEMMDTAEKIFDLHQKAEVIMSRNPVDIIRGRIYENNAMIRCFVPDIFDEEDVDALEAEQLEALESYRELLLKRQADGKIRWCHGDLTLRNLAMWNGQVIPFNPIEFYDDLTQIDTMYDFAFLLVEMESKGQRRLASILFNHYMALSQDWEGVPVLPLFLSCRAAVNAYVFAQRSSEIKDKHESMLMANRAFEQLVIAKRFLERQKPVLVACGGLSGSGKSRIARESAPFIGNPPGAVIVRDDVLRKNMLNAGLEENLDTAEYAPEMEDKVFKEVCAKCRYILSSGQSVMADALFHKPEQRRAIEALAREMNVDFKGLWVDAPLEVRIDRVTQRKRNPSDVKTEEELRKQLDIDVGPITWEQIDTSGDRMATLTRVRTLLADKI